MSGLESQRQTEVGGSLSLHPGSQPRGEEHFSPPSQDLRGLLNQSRGALDEAPGNSKDAGVTLQEKPQDSVRTESFAGCEQNISEMGLGPVQRGRGEFV